MVLTLVRQKKIFTNSQRYRLYSNNSFSSILSSEIFINVDTRIDRTSLPEPSSLFLKRIGIARVPIARCRVGFHHSWKKFFFGYTASKSVLDRHLRSIPSNWRIHNNMNCNDNHGALRLNEIKAIFVLADYGYKNSCIFLRGLERNFCLLIIVYSLNYYIILCLS